MAEAISRREKKISKTITRRGESTLPRFPSHVVSSVSLLHIIYGRWQCWYKSSIFSCDVCIQMAPILQIERMPNKNKFFKVFLLFPSGHVVRVQDNGTERERTGCCWGPDRARALSGYRTERERASFITHNIHMRDFESTRKTFTLFTITMKSKHVHTAIAYANIYSLLRLTPTGTRAHTVAQSHSAHIIIRIIIIIYVMINTLMNWWRHLAINYIFISFYLRTFDSATCHR